MRDLSAFPDAQLRIFKRPSAPPIEAIRSVYLIGICGTGMGSLAGLLHEAGFSVRGSDEAAYPPMSTRLREMNIPVLERFDAANLSPAPDLVVVGNSCTPTHPEAAFARENDLPQLSLPEALAHFFLKDRRALVVTGTHGKTTTTGMLVHVLRSAGRDPGFLVGGVMVNGNVNYGVGTGPHFVIEGDEYDSAYFDKRPKFMHYAPTAAVITSMEFDHADIYDDWDDYRGAFRRFASSVGRDNFLALFGDDPEVRQLIEHTKARVCYYGLNDQNDQAFAVDVRRRDGGQDFDLVYEGTNLGRFHLPMSGKHNLRNALAVSAIALDEGLSPDELREGLSTFLGLKRRQEVLAETDGIIVVDDFAHHPTAVQETTLAVADRWPGRRIVAIFEPRSNSSRRKIFEQAYAQALSGADIVFMSAPPVRHSDRIDDLLDAGAVIESIRRAGITAAAFSGADELLPHLLETLRAGDVALIMSNGSFDGLHARLIDALNERHRPEEVHDAS